MSDDNSFPLVSTPRSHENVSFPPEVGLMTPVSPAAASVTSCSDQDQIHQPLSFEDYIGIGCLIFDLKSEHVPPFSPPNSVDKPLESLLHYDISNELASHLRRLRDSKWVRLLSRKCPSTGKAILRVYLLPQDVGRNQIDRSSNTRQNFVSLEYILPHIDTSMASWNGMYDGSQTSLFDIAATAEDSSLFYIFNKLPSPLPSPALVKDKYTKSAMEDLLNPPLLVTGLKTQLYPYQARSAAMMLQRECSGELILDPRLEKRSAPDGNEFYYGPRDASFLRHPRLYDSARGGILSETMGLGYAFSSFDLIVAELI